MILRALYLKKCVKNVLFKAMVIFVERERGGTQINCEQLES